MTISFEISTEHVDEWPPFTDSCPRCKFAGTVVPYATLTDGDSLLAKYHHGRCGHEWVTSWRACWSSNWVRLIGPDAQQIAA